MGTLKSNVKCIVKKSVNSLASIVRREVLVLLYHRIINLDVDSQLLAVTPENFESQLRYLEKNFNVISYEELVDALKKDKLPRKSVCITFDDGYLDNLEVAKPLLEKHGLPSLFFIATGYIGKVREFWWDELEQYFLCNHELPKNISIESGDSKIDFSLAPWDNLNKEKSLVLRNWNAAQDASNNPRLQAFLYCQKLLKTLDIKEREECLNQLWEQCSEAPVCRQSYRAMQKEELIRFNASPLFTLGAHTVNHCALSRLPYKRMKQEIVASKNELGKIINENTVTFSYPFGFSEDYGKGAVQVVDEAGFQSAFSVNSRRVDRHSNIFEIPRFQVPDLAGDNFRKWLHSVYG